LMVHHGFSAIFLGSAVFSAVFPYPSDLHLKQMLSRIPNLLQILSPHDKLPFELAFFINTFQLMRFR
jgi:TRAP-type mannitol/chloroaromatic compound transport system permease large subunit